MPVKEKVFVDMFITEDTGDEIFFLGSEEAWKKDQRHVMAGCCESSGFFLWSNELDDFLEEHKDELEVVLDFRSDSTDEPE